MWTRTAAAATSTTTANFKKRKKRYFSTNSRKKSLFKIENRLNEKGEPGALNVGVIYLDKSSAIPSTQLVIIENWEISGWNFCAEEKKLLAIELKRPLASEIKRLYLLIYD